MNPWFTQLPYDASAPLISYKDGILKLYDLCIPENPDESLDPLFNEISEFLKTGSNLVIIMEFKAVNSGTSKKFINLFKTLNQFRAADWLFKSKRNIEILWKSPRPDEDMIELGKYYKRFSDKLAKVGKYRKIDFTIKLYNYD